MKIIKEKVNVSYAEELVESALQEECNKRNWLFRNLEAQLYTFAIVVELPGDTVRLDITETGAIIYFQCEDREINIVIEEDETSFEADLTKYFIEELKKADN